MIARTRLFVVALATLTIAGCADDKKTTGGTAAAPPITARDWPQWAHDANHTSGLGVAGQRLDRILADLRVDALADIQKNETNGHLLTHYQVPLVVDGRQVLMAFQGGRFVPCSPPGSGTPFPCGSDAWNTQVWSETLLEWNGAELTRRWSFDSDWKPVPDAGSLGGWEPVFHAVLAGAFAYVPGAGGAVHKLKRTDGSVVTVIRPFGASAPNTYVTGPLSADLEGNIFYNAMRLDGASPWQMDVQGAWLVRVAPDDSVAMVAFSTLVPAAPASSAACSTQFSAAELPWPPAPGAAPPSGPCGSQRPGVNVAPALAGDGTIFTVSRAHFNPRYSYVVSVNRDLSPRWAASLRDRLNDGCGALLGPNGTPGGCRQGATFGVDPATNERPAGQVTDRSSASPTVAPDGSVIYGAFTRYNHARGHLFKFSPGGEFQAAYDFGWDVTPAIYDRGGSYSVIIKENRYSNGSYCSDATHCPAVVEGPYDITQLSSSLVPEWTFTNTTTESCRRSADGGMTCDGGFANGFEWCINAPAVDAEGLVYANAEDGYLYAIEQGGRMRQRIFLDAALGAAYTPISIGSDGRVYTQNNGHLFVVGQ